MEKFNGYDIARWLISYKKALLTIVNYEELELKIDETVLSLSSAGYSNAEIKSVLLVENTNMLSNNKQNLLLKDLVLKVDREIIASEKGAILNDTLKQIRTDGFDAFLSQINPNSGDKIKATITNLCNQIATVANIKKPKTFDGRILILISAYLKILNISGISNRNMDALTIIMDNDVLYRSKAKLLLGTDEKTVYSAWNFLIESDYIIRIKNDKSEVDTVSYLNADDNVDSKKSITYEISEKGQEFIETSLEKMEALNKLVVSFLDSDTLGLKAYFEEFFLQSQTKKQLKFVLK